MEQGECHLCGRPVLVALDLHGRRVELDPEAPVYRAEPDVDGQVTAERCNGHVTHGVVCAGKAQ